MLARSPTSLPVTYLRICRRLRPIVEEIYLSSISLDGTSSDIRLAGFNRLPQSLLHRVEEVYVWNAGSFGPFHVAALAGLVNMRVLQLPDIGASGPKGSQYAADTEGLVHALDKLQTLVLRGSWRVPLKTLPDWLMTLEINARMLQDSTGLDLSATQIRRLHLHFIGGERSLSTLPWRTLEHLGVTSKDTLPTLALALLGLQVCLVTLLSSPAQGRKLMKWSPACADEPRLAGSAAPSARPRYRGENPRCRLAPAVGSSGSFRDGAPPPPLRRRGSRVGLDGIAPMARAREARSKYGS